MPSGADLVKGSYRLVRQPAGRQMFALRNFDRYSRMACACFCRSYPCQSFPSCAKSHSNASAAAVSIVAFP